MVYMKMTKISRIRKYFLMIICGLLSFLWGCGLFKTEIVTFENEITLTCDSRILDYLPYEVIPTYTLQYDGSINISKERQGEFECIFTQNDDFMISSIVKGVIKDYTDKERISFALLSMEVSAEVWMNRRDDIADEKEYLKVKDKKIYNELAYITLENGLQLSFNYARFTDENNILYYRWQKTESIRMILHYPLMVTKIDGQKKFLFMALPNGVRTQFDTTTKKLDVLIKDDKFMGSENYTYSYPNGYSIDYEVFREYYIANFNGRMIHNDFVYTFLGYDFIITFAETNFTITRYNN